MSNRVREGHILHVGLPLRRKFRHAITSRSQSNSIFLKLLLEDGTIGYGESLPRQYVTDETPQSVIVKLRKLLQHRLLGYEPSDYAKVPLFINELNIRGGAIKCSLELALLDVYGRYFRSPISSIIGKKTYTPPPYSGVIQAGSIQDAIKTSLAFKIFGLRFIKVKVGIENDILRLKIIRSILGKEANIRVDANCAWRPAEAVDRINEMRKYNISAVEQPVRQNDYKGLKMVRDSVPETIIADESVCTIDDAERLIELGACNMFNIRLSKCGGLLNSLMIAAIARQHGIGVQLGCQVGESGLLSAAGWHFARMSGDLAFCEGSYGRFLLKEDITRENMTIQRGGRVGPVNGPGFGVNVLDKVLDRYIISKEVVA